MKIQCPVACRSRTFASEAESGPYQVVGSVSRGWGCIERDTPTSVCR